MKGVSPWNSIWERRVHSQCTKCRGGRRRSQSLCASALTFLILASYSISPLCNFPLFVSPRALKATSSQLFLVDGSRAVTGPIGSTVLIVSYALNWCRSLREFAVFWRINTSLVTPTNFSRYRFAGNDCSIDLHISGSSSNILLVMTLTSLSQPHTSSHLSFERTPRALNARHIFRKIFWSITSFKLDDSSKELIAKNDKRPLEMRRSIFSAENFNASRQNSFTISWAAGGKADVIGSRKVVCLECLWYSS